MPIYNAHKKGKLFLGASKIKKAYLGNTKVYSSGNTCTYIVDSGTSYREEFDEGVSVLSPKTFTPAKAGWTFVGWRIDTVASSAVQTNITMGDAPITLYAVFRQTVTLSYAGNGNTGGDTAAQTGTRYWNTGNVSNPTFTLRPNGFTNQWASFSKWALGSTGGTQYAAGSSVALAANTTFYAIWTAHSSIDLISSGIVRISPTTVAPASFSPPHGQSQVSISIGMQKPNQNYNHYGFCVYGYIPNPQDMQYPSATVTWSGLPGNYKKATIELITFSNGYNINSEGHISLNNNSVKLYNGAWSTGEEKAGNYSADVSAPDNNQKTLKITCHSGNTAGGGSSGYSYFMIKKLTVSI